MPRVLRAGVHPERCPTCGGVMSLPIQGRKTGVWIRTCTVEDCRQQTITNTPPAGVAGRGPIGTTLVDVELPFDLSAALRETLDGKLSGAGERGE